MWMRDYVSGEGLSEKEKEDEAFLAMLASLDPVYFEDAVKSADWRKAMDAEIEAIERNDTWELSKLPVGAKKMGVKWVYKTKLNEHGAIEKLKARLVAKGYTQEHGVDYTEVFALVARLETVRLVVLSQRRNNGTYSSLMLSLLFYMASSVKKFLSINLLATRRKVKKRKYTS